MKYLRKLRDGHGKMPYSAWHYKQHGDYVVARLWVGWFFGDVCVGLYGFASWRMSCVTCKIKQLESEQLSPTSTHLFYQMSRTRMLLYNSFFAFTSCRCETRTHTSYYTIINDIACTYYVLVTELYRVAHHACCTAFATLNVNVLFNRLK